MLHCPTLHKASCSDEEHLPHEHRQSHIEVQSVTVRAICLAGDFPDVNRYREILSGYDISTFPKLREKDVKALEETLSIDIPTLVKQVHAMLGLANSAPFLHITE